MDDGNRTHDHRSHNPGLYQLSYIHHKPNCYTPFVTSFATAAVELSATIMLVSAESDSPLSYGIYVYMQSAAGRGPGAALGMVAVIIVAVGTYISHRIIEKGRRERSLETLT